jgi:formylglycine-generating enzyme required for sulfatase activity
MGAQNADPAGPHFDPAVDVDAPFHRVKLGPFLIARHELTQAQWLRLASTGARAREPEPLSGRHRAVRHRDHAVAPVENIGWAEARTLLLRHGMDLPTEAQWEYAARGGTTTPWFVPEAELPRAANLADATCLRVAGANFECEAWSDGHALHAPVGSMLANRFGLFDVAGNVFEWCRDEFGDYRDPCEGPEGLRSAKGDGVLEPDSRRARAVRGGSCMQRALYARSAWRNGVGPELRLNDIGVRALRRLGT